MGEEIGTNVARVALSCTYSGLRPVRGLFESQDGLERKADERVGKEAEQNYAGDGTGQHEG